MLIRNPRPILLYLTDVKLKEQINKPENYGRHSTYGCHSTALRYFRESCTKTYLEDIDRRDLLKFAVFLQGEKEQRPRSIANKFDIVMSFLKGHGITGLIRLPYVSFGRRLLQHLCRLSRACASGRAIRCNTGLLGDVLLSP